MQTINTFTQKPAILLYTFFAALALNSCDSSSGSQGNFPQQSQPSLPVITVSAVPATTYQEYSASLEGSKDIEIRSQVEGYIDRIYVDEGAYVKKGQPLFHINSRPYEEQLNNAKAGLAAARANLANSQINVSRLTPLVQNNVISDVQLQSAKAAYAAAAANVSQAQALVSSAQINLGYALIKAPVDGYVGKILFKTGSLVGMSTVQPLTIISEIKEIYAYFSLSENDFLKFKNQFTGNSIEEKINAIPPIELVLPDGNIYDHKGKVRTVAGQFDQSIGTISFRAVFPNAERLLRSGNTGKVRIPQQHVAILVIPQEATFEIQDKVFVFALGDSNKVISKPIVVSGKTPGYYFVESGVKAGDKIVFTGIGNLRDGMPIVPQPISMDSLLKVKPL